jgi:hypothetical protein
VIYGSHGKNTLEPPASPNAQPKRERLSIRLIRRVGSTFVPRTLQQTLSQTSIGSRNYKLRLSSEPRVRKTLLFPEEGTNVTGRSGVCWISHPWMAPPTSCTVIPRMPSRSV